MACKIHNVMKHFACSNPITGYLKLMDVWQIVSQSVPFLNIIFRSLAHYLKQRDSAVRIQVGTKLFMHSSDKDAITNDNNEKLQIIIKSLTTYLIPVCYLIFLIGFFSYGIWENSKNANNLLNQ